MQLKVAQQLEASNFDFSRTTFPRNDGGESGLCTGVQILQPNNQNSVRMKCIFFFLHFSFVMINLWLEFCLTNKVFHQNNSNPSPWPESERSLPTSRNFHRPTKVTAVKLSASF